MQLGGFLTGQSDGESGNKYDCFKNNLQPEEL